MDIIRLRNKLGEIFYEDVQELDMSGKDWEYYKEFLYEVVMTQKAFLLNHIPQEIPTIFKEIFLYGHENDLILRITGIIR